MSFEELSTQKQGSIKHSLSKPNVSCSIEDDEVKHESEDSINLNAAQKEESYIFLFIFENIKNQIYLQ